MQSHRPQTQQHFDAQSPLDGQGIPGDMRLAVTPILLSVGTALAKDLLGWL